MYIYLHIKYLGDYVTKYGNSKETIQQRKTRGNAIVSEMRALLRDIPLGSFRTQIGLFFTTSMVPEWMLL